MASLDGCKGSANKSDTIMNQSSPIGPPTWPLTILRFFVKKEYAEEIEGDMEEIFYENVEKHSLRKAKRIYAWETLKLMRPSLIKNLKAFQYFNQFNLFGNYFKTSSRSLMKNPMSSFINIFGLSMSLGICVMLYGFATWVSSMDQFHEHKHEVYLITSYANRDGSHQQYGTTPLPLGELMKEEYPQISEVCRIKDGRVIMKYDDRVFHERVRYADASFLKMFTFPLKWGSANSLNGLNSIILSEEMSIKYFGEENPVGKNMLMIFNETNSKAFEIAGVAKKFPESHDIDFSFLVHFDNLKADNPGFDMSDWSSFIDATFIKVDDPNDMRAIEAGMNKYKAFQNEKHHEMAITSFNFIPLANLYREGPEIKGGITSPYYSSNQKAVIILSIVTLFLLALACFNYINIAIVTAAKRLKEIGMRKVIGATRKKVITQFLSENIFITSLALLFGLLLGVFFFIPGFEYINDFSMGFTLAHPALWLFLIGVLLTTGTVSGLYPALYISRFEVVTIFKGSARFGKQNPLNKFLLGFQLILACVIITCAIMFTRNASYVTQRSWGYNQQSTLFASVHNQLAYEQLQAAMSQNPHVISMAGSTDHVGKSHANKVIYLPTNQQYEVQAIAIDPAYFSTLEIPLKEGRFFLPDSEADKQKLIVNETLVRNLDWHQAIGQTIDIDSIRYEVVGVVNDLHSYDFDMRIEPTVFQVADKTDYRYLTLRSQHGHDREVYAALQAQWIKLFPEIPFEGGYQEDVWGSFFRRMENHGRFWQAVALIATLLAGLGLYGLVTLNVTGRTKEFSIRKVLGAPAGSIAGGILRQYLVLFIVSLALGTPVSYVLTSQLFDVAYEYHAPVTVTSVLAGTVFLIFLLFVVVFSQVRKVATTSPVAGLKAE
jgi:putative ABC transport system permease protein